VTWALRNDHLFYSRWILMITPAAVLDALYGLLDAEEGSIFRFMREGSPYLNSASVEVRRQVEAMADDSFRHAAELGGLIEQRGGVMPPAMVHPDNQYVAYLSYKFLLPKLAEAKRRSIERYENARRVLKDAPAEVVEMLDAHLVVHRADLKALGGGVG
jgi:hypothetical protein